MLSPDDVHALLRSRKSIRRYRSARPTPASIVRILESVAHAPSAHNRQPWRYMVVSGAMTKDKLAAAMGLRLVADLLHREDPAEIRRIEQRTVSAVVDVEFVTAPAVDLDRSLYDALRKAPVICNE